MKAYNEAQQATIATAAAAIKAAALEAITAIVTAKGNLTVVIRDQVTALEKADIAKKDIAVIVRDNVKGAASPSHISRTLTACGIRLRGKRTDAGFLRMADAALDAAAESKPAAADGDESGEGDESEGDESGEAAGSGHTAETLAALLASLDPAMVEQALEIAGLMDFMHG